MKLRSIIDPNIRIRDFIPHTRLKAFSVCNQPDECPAFKTRDEYLRKEVLCASMKVQTRSPSEEFCSMQIGPRKFNDIPLDHLLEMGGVIGVDINQSPMAEIKSNLPADLGRKLILLSLDVSLFATAFISEMESSIALSDTFCSVSNSIYAAIDRFASSIENKKLPFTDGSCDFIVINHIFDDMLAFPLNIFYWDLFAGKYGWLVMQEYFSSPGPGGSSREFLLMKKMGLIRRALLKRYFEEIFRLLKPGGIAFFACRQIECFSSLNASSGEFELYSNHYQCTEPRMRGALELECEGPKEKKAIIELGERDDRFGIKGPESLHELLRGWNGRVVDQFLFWNPFLFLSENEAKVTLDEAVVIKKE